MYNINIKDITIGSDPEVFIKNPLDDNKVVPAYYFIKGTKEEPEIVTQDGFKIQYDNVLAEYNIPPCNTKEDWINAHNFMLNYIKDTICTPHSLSLGIVASDHIEQNDAEHTIASAFGCSPDYNIWTDSQNKAPLISEVGLLRSAGCHIAVGYPDSRNNITFGKNLIKNMDLFLGVPSVVLDDDINRKKLYGKAGCYRLTPFGVEYRVLSNFVLTSNDLLGWAYESTLKAVEFTLEGKEIDNPEKIIHCINNSDSDMARSVMEDYLITIPSSIYNAKFNKLLNIN